MKTNHSIKTSLSVLAALFCVTTGYADDQAVVSLCAIEGTMGKGSVSLTVHKCQTIGNTIQSEAIRNLLLNDWVLRFREKTDNATKTAFLESIEVGLENRSERLLEKTIRVAADGLQIQINGRSKAFDELRDQKNSVSVSGTVSLLISGFQTDTSPVEEHEIKYVLKAVAMMPVYDQAKIEFAGEEARYGWSLVGTGSAYARMMYEALSQASSTLPGKWIETSEKTFISKLQKGIEAQGNYEEKNSSSENFIPVKVRVKYFATQDRSLVAFKILNQDAEFLTYGTFVNDSVYSPVRWTSGLKQGDDFATMNLIPDYSALPILSKIFKTPYKSKEYGSIWLDQSDSRLPILKGRAKKLFGGKK